MVNTCCQWPGNTRSQGISSQNIYLVFPAFPSLSIKRVNENCISNLPTGLYELMHSGSNFEAHNQWAMTPSVYTVYHISLRPVCLPVTAMLVYVNSGAETQDLYTLQSKISHWWHTARLRYLQCISNGDTRETSWHLEVFQKNFWALRWKSSWNFIFV